MRLRIALQDRMRPRRWPNSAASMILSWPPYGGSDDVTGRSEERGLKTARCEWWRPGGGGMSRSSTQRFTPYACLPIDELGICSSACARPCRYDHRWLRTAHPCAPPKARGYETQPTPLELSRSTPGDVRVAAAVAIQRNCPAMALDCLFYGSKRRIREHLNRCVAVIDMAGALHLLSRQRCRPG